jgi:hypothetical protein
MPSSVARSNLLRLPAGFTSRKLFLQEPDIPIPIKRRNRKIGLVFISSCLLQNAEINQKPN